MNSTNIKINYGSNSIIITIPGLSVDFSLHYSIMYKLSGQSDRLQSVRYSVSTMAAPVTMAAFTTFTAGCCLFPARLVYIFLKRPHFTGNFYVINFNLATCVGKIETFVII